MNQQILPLNEQISPLPHGTPAPDFVLPRTPQASISLDSLRGSPVVLVFYPLDWEPVTREQLSLYQAHRPELGQFDAFLLGISVDPISSHEAFAREVGIDFPLLSDSDPKGAVSRLYGVYRESVELSGRALFVVDGHGVIWFSEAYPDSVNPGVNGILSTLEAIAEAEKVPPKRGASRTVLETITEQVQRGREAGTVVVAGFAIGMTIALIFLVYVIMEAAHLLT